MIRLFSGKIRISLLIIPAVFVYIAVMGISSFGSFVLALLTHELAHLAMASVLGVGIVCFEVMPYGCAAKLISDELQGKKELLTALAGPAVSLMLSAIVYQYGLSGFALDFAKASLGLALINLIPACKTDGGRVLYVLLKAYIKEKTARRLMITVSLITAFAMIALFAAMLINGDLNISLVIIAIFMLINTFGLLKAERVINNEKLALRSRILNGEAQVVFHAIRADESCYNAAAVMQAGKYNIYICIDENMNISGSVTETELLKTAIKRGGAASVISACKR